ncbi:hypothetical protein MP638_000222 [Amoeboaphelidium occidentale]|nr:hypothetical protein MP638_000222 [Amoeboaphelidium occidentale]
MAMNFSLYSTKAFILLDSEGKRLIAKYYSKDFPTIKEQKAFEKSLFEKSKKTSNEIMLLDGLVAVYRNNVDVFFYLIGSVDENELVLSHALNSFYDAVSIILKSQIEKRTILDHMDAIMLALDETIDNGIILEVESQNIAHRVSKKNGDVQDNPFSEQSVQQALQNAREMAKNWLRA